MNQSSKTTYLQRLFAGWVLITGVYFLTMIVSFEFYDKPGMGLNWEMTNPTAFWMITVPYFFGGIYCRYTVDKSRWVYPLLVSAVPLLSERILILFIGYRLFVSGGDGSMEGITLLMFIRGEAAPYFTPLYIFFGGIISVILTMAITCYKNVTSK